MPVMEVCDMSKCPSCGDCCITVTQKLRALCGSRVRCSQCNGQLLPSFWSSAVVVLFTGLLAGVEHVLGVSMPWVFLGALLLIGLLVCLPLAAGTESRTVWMSRLQSVLVVLIVVVLLVVVWHK